jgi:thioredoxin-related protein
MNYFLKRTLFCLVLIFLLSSAYAQINFEKGTWKEVLAKAQKENKPVFVDFYAVWCGPCKFMTKDVFTNPEVADYYNANFLAYKVDAEKEERELVASAKIDAYPSLFYYNPQGELITKNVGALDAKGFKKFGEGALANMKAIGNLPTLKAKYDKNPYDNQVTTEYLNLLMQAQKFGEAEPIAQKYLAQLADADLTKENAWKLIKQFVKSTESREYKYMVANQKVFFEKYGEDFQRYLLGMVNEKLNHAIQTKSVGSLTEAKNIYYAVGSMMDASKPKEYFEMEIDLHYFKATQQWTDYFGVANHWIEKYQAENFQELFDKSMTIAENSTNKTELEKARAWTEKLLTLNQDALSYVANAVILEKLGNKTEALKNAKVAAEKTQDAELRNFIGMMLKRLEK